jgi:hypothetical protein
MQDPTFRGLSNLWTRYDRGRSSLEPIPGPGDITADGSKSPGKATADKKRKSQEQEETLLDNELRLELKSL